MKLITLTLLLSSFAFLSSCMTAAEKKKPKGPQSSASNLPWARPQPGEGGAGFGGLLDRR